MLALPIFMPRFKRIIFLIKIALKLRYFGKKMQNFRALGASPPDPRAYGGWGFALRPPKQPPTANIWLRACQ